MKEAFTGILFSKISAFPVFVVGYILGNIFDFCIASHPSWRSGPFRTPLKISARVPQKIVNRDPR
jgi:hypothetical protein